MIHVCHLDPRTEREEDKALRVRTRPDREQMAGHTNTHTHTHTNMQTLFAPPGGSIGIRICTVVHRS